MVKICIGYKKMGQFFGNLLLHGFTNHVLNGLIKLWTLICLVNLCVSSHMCVMEQQFSS